MVVEAEVAAPKPGPVRRALKLLSLSSLCIRNIYNIVYTTYRSITYTVRYDNSTSNTVHVYTYMCLYQAVIPVPNPAQAIYDSDQPSTAGPW